MKSGSEGSFYVPGEAKSTFNSTPATAGPWGPQAQHGSPPSALMTRALEALLEPGQTLARITVELLGPIPLAPLEVATSVIRPGRTVSLLGASLTDLGGGRECATARAWVMPRSEDGPGSVTPLPHKPDDGAVRPVPDTWSRGYLDHIDWRFMAGEVGVLGPATAWMRQLVPLVPDEEPSGLQRLMTVIDSASGISAVLDVAEWAFMNTELTVHILREPVGEWVCVDAETSLAGSGVGLTTSSAYDERGLVARSAQALLLQSATK